MPLPHFLVLIAFVIVAAGLTLWAVQAMALPLGATALLALAAALAVRALAWR